MTSVDDGLRSLVAKRPGVTVWLNKGREVIPTRYD